MSADMLLGVPHNWVQSWAMLMYFAHHANLQVGTMTWMWGDAHIYKEESHLQAVDEIFSYIDEHCQEDFSVNPELQYNFCGEYDDNNVPVFKASDFTMVGEIPAPVVKVKPKLL